jgi:hypothetical protein
MLPGSDVIIIELERIVDADGSVTAPAGRGRLVRRDRTRPL